MQRRNFLKSLTIASATGLATAGIVKGFDKASPGGDKTVIYKGRACGPTARQLYPMMVMTVSTDISEETVKRIEDFMKSRKINFKRPEILNMKTKISMPIPTFDKRLYETMPDRFIKANPKIY